MRHECHASKVDAACEQVRRDQHAQLECMHAAHRGQSLLMRESARDECRREAARRELARQPGAFLWSITEDERLVEGDPLEQLQDLSTARRRERLGRALALAVLLLVRAAAPDDAVVLSDAGKCRTSDELRRCSWYAAGRRAVGGASASCPFALGRLAAEAQGAIEQAEWIARVGLVRGWRERRQQ